MKFQGDIIIFCDCIQVFVFTTNHHLNASNIFYEFLTGGAKVAQYSSCEVELQDQ